MTDDELHSLAHLYVVGALDPDEARTFEAHLAGCADCRKEVAAMNEVTAHLSEIVAAEPPAGLRSAVLAQIAGTAQDLRSIQLAAQPPVSSGRHAAAAKTAEPHSHATVVPLRHPWRQRISILVAAAAVVGAVGVGGWALNERNDARDQAASSQRMADELTAILSSGDAQTVTSSTSTGAVTSVVRSPSRGIALLLASDLPALPAGKTYQAWTIDNDKPTSAGIFESQGAQTIFELPAAAVKTSVVAISIERAGGAETPSPPIVALGLS